MLFSAFVVGNESCLSQLLEEEFAKPGNGIVCVTLWFLSDCSG